MTDVLKEACELKADFGGGSEFCHLFEEKRSKFLQIRTVYCGSAGLIASY